MYIYTPYTVYMQIAICRRCGAKWNTKVEHPKNCAKCRSPYWDKPVKRLRVSQGRKVTAIIEPEESDDEIQASCVMEYGIMFMQSVQQSVPGWRALPWTTRREILKREHERMEQQCG